MTVTDSVRHQKNLLTLFTAHLTLVTFHPEVAGGPNKEKTPLICPGKTHIRQCKHIAFLGFNVLLLFPFLHSTSKCLRAQGVD